MLNQLHLANTVKFVWSHEYCRIKALVEQIRKLLRTKLVEAVTIRKC